MTVSHRRIPTDRLPLDRKNYLFCGNHDAAVRAAIIYSLFTCCKAVCFLDEEFCVKRVDTTSGCIVLRPCAEDDERFPPVPVDPDDEITIFGVVTWVIQKA